MMALEPIARLTEALAKLGIRESDVLILVDMWRDDAEVGRFFKKIVIAEISKRTKNHRSADRRIF